MVIPVGGGEGFTFPFFFLGGSKDVTLIIKSLCDFCYMYFAHFVDFTEKEPVAKEPVYWNDFALWDTATRYSRCGQNNHILWFSLVPVRIIISVQEIHSDTLFQPAVQYWLAGFIFFAKLFYLIPRLIICFYFLWLEVP